MTIKVLKGLLPVEVSNFLLITESRFPRDNPDSCGGRQKQCLAAGENAIRRSGHEYLSFAIRVTHIARRRESDRSRQVLLCWADHRRC
jgi:hypothetical protein